MLGDVKDIFGFFFHVYQCFACMCYLYECAPSACLVPRETRKGQVSGLKLESQVLVAMCGLGTKAESPAWTASAPHHRVISPAPVSFLTGLICVGFCTGNNSCYELMYAVAMRSPGERSSQPSAPCGCFIHFLLLSIEQNLFC